MWTYPINVDAQLSYAAYGNISQDLMQMINRNGQVILQSAAMCTNFLKKAPKVTTLGGTYAGYNMTDSDEDYFERWMHTETGSLGFWYSENAYGPWNQMDIEINIDKQ